ncbi:MAG: sulfur carrier protein ThiS [Streptomycetaceae bacterium]|nr:sulfur carrier protein ThiS [Streptomycetaceae bacterium]
MNLVVNGEATEVADGYTTTELVEGLTARRTGIAVAVDGEVLPRHEWDTALHEGASVEVLTAVQGG